MAIKQVQAQFDGQWYTLEYDKAARAWTASFVPDKTSFAQPGQVFHILVEARNDAGVTTQTSGGQRESLRLRVNETDPPQLTPLSPVGVAQTATPTISFQALDPEGGSGIDQGSIRLEIDGEAVEGFQVAESGGFYTISYTPGKPLAEGPHTAVLSLEDFDGNQTSSPLPFTVDTIPPALYLTSPHYRSVVDTPTVTLEGRAQDATTPPVLVWVELNGSLFAQAEPDTGTGAFSWELPLLVGGNTVKVTAQDAAGWQAVRELFLIRLVTDRTQADVDALQALLARPAASWTKEETEAYLSGRLRGGYTSADFNRVTLAASHLSEKFSGYGYLPEYVPVEIEPGRTTWLKKDYPTPGLTSAYLANVERLRALLDVPIQLPKTMEHFTYSQANALEKALVLLDEYAPYINAVFYAGEVYTGEV